MTTFDRFERELPAVIEDLYLGPTPTYRDDLLSRTAATRQRPGWSLPERWLPLDAYSQRVAGTTAVPWRMIGAVALLILALVVGALLIAGNRPTRLPEPFGLAANGLVALAGEGDIYAVDPRTGRVSPIVTGPEWDTDPVWSLDGTRIAFLRQPEAGSSEERLVVANADGSDVLTITPEPLAAIGTYSFSPDGRDVLLSYDGSLYPKVAIAATDGSGVRVLNVGMAAVDPVYRPSGGAEIAFTGFPEGPGSYGGIYVMNASGEGPIRTLVEASADSNSGEPRWSPDGSLIAYATFDDDIQVWTVQTHVIAADGTGDRALPALGDSRWNGGPVWSNDATRLALVRGYSLADDSDVVLAVVPADGSSVGVHTPRSLLERWPYEWVWAPDDTSILVTPMDPFEQPRQQLLMDPLTAETRTAPWRSTSFPAWQRVAPPGS